MTGVTSITDLHLRKANTKTEPQLLATQEKLMADITEVCLANSKKYDKHIIIFYGDICDRQLSEITFVKVCYWLKELSLHSKLYVVRGNHEVTYKGKFNVFWHVAYGKKFSDTKYEHIDDLLEFVDDFKVDSTQFILNHNNSYIAYEENDEIKNIVIASHNAMIMPELEDMLNEDPEQDPKSNYIHYTGFKDFLPNTDKIRYILAGHMHSLYGQYRIQERFNGNDCDFVMYYLSSLGRPKSNEFTDNKKRDLPTIEVDGDSIKLVHNYIQLSGKEVLDEEEILARHETYKEGKHIKAFKKVTFSSMNVLDEIKRAYEMDMSKNYILTNALNEDNDNEIDIAIQNIKKINVYE